MIDGVGSLRRLILVWHAGGFRSPMALQAEAPCSSTSAQYLAAAYCVQRTPGAIAGDPVAPKTPRAKRDHVLAAKENQNDAREDEMNALFEFLTTEPPVCSTA